VTSRIDQPLPGRPDTRGEPTTPTPDRPQRNHCVDHIRPSRLRLCRRRARVQPRSPSVTSSSILLVFGVWCVGFAYGLRWTTSIDLPAEEA
jgi:hypothetical protein